MDGFFEESAGYRDADIEMAELYAAGARNAELRRRGFLACVSPIPSGGRGGGKEEPWRRGTIAR